MRKTQELSRYAMDLIRCKARQLIGKAGFTRSDVEDIEQDLALDLLERLPKYDASKAAETTFVARVVERKISKLLRHRAQERRYYGRVSCSLDDLVEDGDGRSIARSGIIGGAQPGDAACGADEATNRRHDVSRVLDRLPEDLRGIAERLRTRTVMETAKDLGVPRTTLYGAVNRIRTVFEEAGLRDYLHPISTP